MAMLFKISFLNQGKVYEMYCRKVQGSELAYGLVEARELVFGTEGGVVIDPTEEQLREEFREVEVLHIPLHSVLRIEQVRKRGTARIRDRKSDENVTPLPLDGPRRKR